MRGVFLGADGLDAILTALNSSYKTYQQQLEKDRQKS